MRKTVAVIVLVLVILALTTPALLCIATAQGGDTADGGPVVLAEERDRYRLSRQLEILEDPGGQLGIEEVTSPPYAARFQPNREKVPNYGLTKSAFWARLRVRNQARDTGTWWLELSDGRMGFVDLYYPTLDGQGWVHKRAGRLLPFAARDIPHHHYVFALPLPHAEERTVYLRLESNAAMTFPLTLWSPAAFAQYSQGDLLFLGIYYGIMLIMIAYNFVLFLFLREASYLYYVLLVTCIVVNQASYDGIAHQHLWPAAPYRYGMEVFAFLTMALALKFTSEFLRTKELAPGLHKAIAVWALLGVLAALATLFIQRVNAVVNLYVLIGGVLMLATTVLLTWRKVRAARFFLAASIGALIVALVQPLTSFGVLPRSWISTKGSYVAGVLLVTLLALALADRINVLQQETQRANRALRASESRLQQYLEAMPAGITVRDANGRLRYENQRARQMRHWPDEARADGQAGEGTLEETIEEVPLYVSGTRQAYPLERLPPARALQGESVSVNDVEIEVGGQRIPLEIWSSPVLDEQGSVQYAISAVQDISERVQAQARIRDRLAVETALSNISTRLVQATDLDRAISETLAEVGSLLAFDRLFLARIRPDRAELEMTHEWCAAGVRPLLPELQGVPLADVPWLLGQLHANGIVYVQDTSALPPQAAQEKRFIEEHLGGRRCALPIWMGAELDGFLACHSHLLTSPVLENEVQVLETVAGMLSSVLQRSRVLETLESRVNDRTRELDTLYRVTTQTSAAQPLEVTLRRALEVVLPALGAPMGTIHLRGDGESPLRLVTHDGFPAQAIRELAGHLPEEVWWRQVWAQDRPLLLLRDPCAEPQVLPWACLAGIEAYLGVPIRVAGTPEGVFSVFGETGQEFTAEEMALLATVADQLGVAVESDRLRLRAAEARVVRERQRLARDLHDAVTQSLYSLTLFAEAAREMCQGGQMDRAHQYLVRIGQTAQRALREMRLLIYELRPPDLERGGLVQALEHRLEAVERRAGIEATLVADGSDHGLPLPVEEALYRIAQEALNNVLKHAAATQVEMILTVGEQGVELSVRDDGQGFDPGAARQGGGMGLANIRQRASDLGGTATIISTPGQGTEVRATLPVAWVQEPEQEGAT